MLIDLAQKIRFVPLSDGTLTYFDATRSKWLSIDRTILNFGLDNPNISSDRYMEVTSGIVSNLSSYRLIRNCTIISMSCQSSNLANCIFHVQKNNLGVDIESLLLSNENGTQKLGLNVDLNQGDYLQVLLEPVLGNVDYPVFSIEIAWRQ